MIRGTTAVFALLGRPVRHSASPEIHNRLFALHGLDAVYVALEPPVGTPLGPVLRCLSGANVTAPLKAEVAGALDELTPVARAAGAVNTVFWRDGRLCGDNTDGEGFLRGLREAFGAVAPRRVAVLGAGGAARAVAWALQRAGVHELRFVVRDPARARAVLDAAELAATVDPFGPEALGFGPDLVVNATPTSARDRIEALGIDALPTEAIWCDLNYHDPAPPRFVVLQARGVRVLGGGPMLRHQALLAFERFTGLKPDAAALEGLLPG